jgi:hypothetical protein
LAASLVQLPLPVRPSRTDRQIRCGYRFHPIGRGLLHCSLPVSRTSAASVRRYPDQDFHGCAAGDTEYGAEHEQMRFTLPHQTLVGKY